MHSNVNVTQAVALNRSLLTLERVMTVMKLPVMTQTHALITAILD